MKAEVLSGFEQKGYELRRDFQEDDRSRHAFNELTRKTFGFDFEQWYLDGYWTENYQPYTIFCQDIAIANVSVNPMVFEYEGNVVHYVQLGTVMTAIEHRGEGLGKVLMDRVLEEWADRVDGFFLFGNDGVLSYYPKFGFIKQREHQGFISREVLAKTVKELTDHIHRSNFDGESRKGFIPYPLDHPNKVSYLEERIRKAKKHKWDMKGNLSLHMFYLRYLMETQVYYQQQKDYFIIARIEEGELKISQIYAQEEIDPIEAVTELIYDVFWEDYNKEVFTQCCFEFVPKDVAGIEYRFFKEEDSTLFVRVISGRSIFLGEKLMFPVLSHT